MKTPFKARLLSPALAAVLIASPAANANPGQPDTGLPVGVPVVLGHTHATVAKGQDGKIYFAGNTGSAWQTSRLHSPYPLANETNNVTFALDAAYHRASFSDSTGTEIRGVRSMAPWYDGSLLVGGDFTRVDGADRPYLVRLNPNGTPDTAFPPRFNGVVHAVVLQTDGKILVGGDFTRVTYTTGGGGELTTTTHHDCPGFTRLNSDGTLDAAFHLANRFGAGHPSGVSIQAIAVDRVGQILVGGKFVTVHWGGEIQTRDGYARLRPDGSFDSTFPNVDLDPPPGYTRPEIRTIAIQPDGKIVLGGSFGYEYESGGGLIHSRDDLIRLLANGEHDTGFSPPVIWAYGPPLVGGFALPRIEAVHARADGRLLIGTSAEPGWDNKGLVLCSPAGFAEDIFRPDDFIDNRVTSFVSLADGSVLAAGRLRVAGFSEDRWLTRLHRDLSASPGNGFPVLPPNYYPNAMVQRPDGRWVVGGTRSLASFPGLAAGFLAGGKPDDHFPSLDGLTGPVSALAVLPDDTIIIGGNFTLVNGSVTHRGIVRFLPGIADGELDDAYGTGVDGWVHSVAVLPDGKLLIAGRFTATGAGGATRQHLARLYAAGTLDLTFNANLGFTDPNPLVWDVDVDAQGRMVVSGNFDSVGGTAKPGFARLLENGGIEPTLTTTISGGRVFMTTLLGDGRMLIAGSFTGAGGFTQAGGPTLLRGEDGSADGAGGFLPSITWPLARGADTHFLGVEAMAAQTDGQIVVSRRFRRGPFQQGVSINDYWNEVSLLPTTDSPSAKFLNYLDALSTGSAPGFPFNYLNHASTLIEADGRLLVGGEFTKTTDGVFRGPVARLRNDPAESYLSVSGGNSISWSRQGAAPEAQSVTFDISTNGGQTWSAAGTSTRDFATWTWSGTLPDRGIARARAIIPTGGTAHGAGSSAGLVEAHTYFRYPLVLRFRSWMADYIPNLGSIPSYILFSLDSDGDGMRDLMEFALGTHPLSGLSGPIPLQFSGNFQSGSFTSHGTPTMHVVGTGPSADRRMLYSRRKDHVEAGLVYLPQFSTDLRFWFECADPGLVIADDATHELIAVPLPASTATSDKLFFRVGLLGEADDGQL